MPISVIERSRACLAALSAASFPRMPMWLGLHHKIMVLMRSSVVIFNARCPCNGQKLDSSTPPPGGHKVGFMTPPPSGHDEM